LKKEELTKKEEKGRVLTGRKLIAFLGLNQGKAYQTFAKEEEYQPRRGLE